MFPLRDNIPSRRLPFVNYVLIAVNLAVFIHEARIAGAGLIEPFFLRWAFIPALFWSDPAGQWPSVVSAMFLHGGWMHVIGNMWYLWIFGDNVEDRLGRAGYMVFYFATGILAALAQAFFFPASRLPMVGASGAISGVLGAYFLLYPKARILAFLPMGFFSRIVELPAFMFLAFWFLLQAFQGVGSLAVAGHAAEAGGGVAWWAHAGGFLSGAVLVLVFPKRRR